MQRDANNTKTVLFTMFFAFMLYGHMTEECNISWPIAGEAVRCTFWTSCSGFIKTSFLVHNAHLWVHLACGEANLGSTSSAHRQTLGCFWYSFVPGYMVN